MGLCVPVLMMPCRVDIDHPYNSFTPKGDYSAIFYDFSIASGSRVHNILDGHHTLFSTYDITTTFAVLNIADEATDVLLPENGRCLAVKLNHKRFHSWEIPEDLALDGISCPVTLDIVRHNGSSFRISKADLNRHGMTFRTMHL